MAGVLAKSEWQSYCDRLSKGLEGKRAQIEVAGYAFGNRTAAWLPLQGITYDPRDDVLEIVMEGLDHLIHKPRDISVDGGPEALTKMEIVDSDGRRQIIKLMEQ
jgi:hypothetical protein